MKTNIQYAHCTKFTAGEKDVHPHSAYEMRYAEVDIYMEEDPEYNGCDWYVRRGNVLVGTGETREDALNSAAYWLMDYSRKVAMGNG